MSTVTTLPARHRAVFVSDVHLGSRHCHAAELAQFLRGLRCTHSPAITCSTPRAGGWACATGRCPSS